MQNKKTAEKNPSQPASAGPYDESRDRITKTTNEKSFPVERRALLTCLGAAALGSSITHIVPVQAKGVAFVGRGFDRIDSIPDKLGFNSNSKVKTTALDPKSLQQLDNDLREQIELLKTIKNEVDRCGIPSHDGFPYVANTSPSCCCQIKMLTNIEKTFFLSPCRKSVVYYAYFSCMQQVRGNVALGKKCEQRCQEHKPIHAI
jgi:hypothetical protein